MAAVDPTLQTPETAKANGQRQPDPRALQDHLPDAEIILFGSRAAGTWNPWSDIDLALIGTPHFLPTYRS
ncbi:MAG: nucleotidyltransferase domain-containing protein [Caldilineaceae bacterium]|nr:nucleotidyltransferase domain-containing protein [Caldilineaceae bacterium]